jgi:ketosteroid isomerase-like protein
MADWKGRFRMILSETKHGSSAEQGAILALERGAFERWAHGDVSGFLEISDPEVSYFDPFLESRLEGLPALQALYEPLRGKIRIERWEMVNPQVVVAGGMAVLSFQFAGEANGQTTRWNTTEVYRRTGGEWRIVHSHWSLTKPELVKPLE